MTEAENPLEQMTVQERLNLSKEHYKAGAFDKAVDVLSTISADENPQAYATAQNNLGIVYRDQGKVEQAVEAWNRIPKDVPELYAKAHNNLASAYIKQGETDKALEAWKNIPSAAPKQYAMAQFKLGVTYAQQNNDDEAIERYQRVPTDGSTL